MTQAHDRMMQEIGARDMRISQLTNETSQLQSMVEQSKSALERMTSDHQFQTNRLESELSQARVVDAHQRETIRQLEERLAAMRHTSAASTAIVKAPDPQVIGQPEDQGQSRILSWIILSLNPKAKIIRNKEILLHQLHKVNDHLHCL